MTKQDIRLRNRRVKRQAGLVLSKLMASIGNRILKPVLVELAREDNLDENGVIEVLRSVYNRSDLDHRVRVLRVSRNMSDLRVYAGNYLKEVTQAYEKEKAKRQVNTD